MRLAYYDRANPSVTYILPKLGHKRDDLFAKESTIDYAKRFFQEIKHVSNIGIVKVTKGKERILFKRDM